MVMNLSVFFNGFYFTCYISKLFVTERSCTFLLQVDLSRVDNVCSLMLSLLFGNGGDKSCVDAKSEKAELLPLICSIFVFSYVWGLGGNLVETSMDAFDTFCRDIFGDNHNMKVHTHAYTHAHTHT